MTRTSKYNFFFMITIVVLLLKCSDFSNPFLDASLARAEINEKTFIDKDTVTIFSKETLSIVILLREHINKVTIHIDDNRLWVKPDTVFQSDDFSGKPIIIPFSIYDTGWKNIDVTTYLKKGGTFSTTCSLYAQSPLYQNQIMWKRGDTILLKTPPVKDTDILYVWDFHDGTQVKDYLPENYHLIKNEFTSPMGELYVVDRMYRSPSSFFQISSGSKPVLEITCINDSIFGDSVYTSETDFTLKVSITESEHIKSFSINNEPFSKSTQIGNSILLSKTFQLDSINNPLKTIVKLIDKKGIEYNKTFYIHYNKNLTPIVPDISILLPVNKNDTSYVLDTMLSLYGTITGLNQQNKHYLKFSVNGFVVGFSTIADNSSNWSYKLACQNNWNVVKVDLLRDSTSTSSILVSITLHVNVDPEGYDADPPQIKTIKVDNTTIANKKFTSDTNNVQLAMIVSDNKKVASVTVNGDTAALMEDGLTNRINISPVHTKEGTQFVIIASDVAGNRSSDTITGIYNRKPEITSVSIPTTLRADSMYCFVIKGTDRDNDDLLTSVKIKRKTGDTVFTVINDSVYWKPSIADTGILNIMIHISDNFSAYVDSTVSLFVFQDSETSIPVSWLTKANEFPDSIIIGKGPLALRLRIAPKTGTPPFTYKAMVENPVKVIYEDTSANFSWNPGKDDAGLRSLHFIVIDKRGSSDTLDILLDVIAHPAALVSITEQKVKVYENGLTESAIFKLSKPLRDTVRVTYSIEFISASSSDLGMNTVGNITFIPGDTLAILPVEIINDTLLESDEKFIIKLRALPPLSSRDSIAIDKGKSALDVIIHDDDQQCVTFGFSGTAKSDKENVGEIAIGVYIDSILDDTLVLEYAFDKKLSTADKDDFKFSNSNQKLIFAPGKKNAELKLIIEDDKKVEPDEVLVLKLHSDDPRAIPGTGISFSYTIVDNDSIEKVGVLLKPDYEVSIPEGSNLGAYPAIILTKALLFDLTVTIKATEASTATYGSDYTLTDTCFVIKAGKTNIPLGLNTINNNEKEGVEIFEYKIISISDTETVYIHNQSTSRIKILDND